MKYRVISFLMFIFINKVNSQEFTLFYIGKAQYLFSFAIDSTNIKNIKEERMILYFNDNQSLYKSFESELADSIINTNARKIYSSGNTNFKENPLMQGIRKGSKSELFFDFKANSLHRKEYLFGYYLIHDTIKKIKWVISSDTMKIDGLKCQKAMATFGGRNYIAWFSLDLPFSCGPWKLNGLPGLIIKAYDMKGEVQFSLININFYNENRNNISLNTKNCITTSKKDFRQMLKIFFDNPEEFIKNNTRFETTEASGFKVHLPPGYKIQMPKNSIELSSD